MIGEPLQRVGFGTAACSGLTAFHPQAAEASKRTVLSAHGDPRRALDVRTVAGSWRLRLRIEGAPRRVTGQITGTLPQIDAVTVEQRRRDGFRFVIGSGLDRMTVLDASIGAEAEHPI